MIDLLPSQKIVYAIRENHKLDELKMFIKPEMLTGVAKSIYENFYNDYLREFTIQEIAFYDEFHYDKCGFIPIVPKTLVQELKDEYEQHFLTNIYPKLKSSDDISSMLAEVHKVTEIFNDDTYNFDTEIEKVLEKRSGVTKGIETGVEFLDKYTLGLKKGHLWVIGGYTSSGKTQFTLQIARNALSKKASVMYVSIEMTKTDILDRMIKIEKQFTDNDIDTVRDYSFSIVDKVHTLNDLRALIVSNPKQIFIIDFIQNLDCDGKTEYEKVTKTIRELQILALHRECCIIAVSQISNEGARTNSQLMSFKGSGAIAAAADVAVELRRTEKKEKFEPTIVSATMKKNRHGELAKENFKFNSEGILAKLM